METQDKNLIKKIISYWDNQPCNILNSNSAIGTYEYFEENSSNRYLVEPHIKSFADFQSYKGKRVLEIGCGIGADGVEFAKHGAEYVGIDISCSSLEIAKKRFSVYNLKGSFYEMSGDDPALINLGKFDLVYSFGVIHHYPNAHAIINNIYELLTDDGVFKFMVYATNSWKNAMIRSGLDQYEAQVNCPLANTYTTEQINALLVDKFKNITITQDHCFMYNIADYKQRVYTLEPWFSNMPSEMINAIRKYLGWHLLVTCIKNK